MSIYSNYCKTYAERNRKYFYSILSAIKINMLKEQRVDTLHPGNAFREWLIDVLNDRIRNKRCDVAVYKLGPAPTPSVDMSFW